jgi:hypothetical protein
VREDARHCEPFVTAPVTGQLEARVARLESNVFVSRMGADGAHVLPALRRKSRASGAPSQARS